MGYPMAMAAAIGERLGLTAAEIAAGTAAYAPVGSRMHLIRMDGDRLVIDDCYNANPQSMAEGIRMLAASRQKKRLAVLGDMGELGALTAQAHRDMGTLCRELGIETVAVGEKMKALTETDPEAQWFAGVEEALPAVRARFTPGTAVLVKASHAVHFENIVKELEKEKMVDIRVSGLVKSFDLEKRILDGLSFQVDSGERVGLLGRNGAGKTTVFRMLTGELEPDEGEIQIAAGRRVGLISQIPVYPEGYTVEDVLQTAFARMFRMKDEMDALALRMEQGDSGADTLRRYGELNAKFEGLGGWDTETAVNKVANGLSIPREMRQREFACLSGGEKTRVNLGRLILEDTDILLLDEPTNHLDLQATEWLEGYLRRFRGTVLTISHDRYFLDRTVTRIIEIQDGKAEFYSGNYSFYAIEKERRYQERMKQYLKEQAKIAQLEKAAATLDRWAEDIEMEAPAAAAQARAISAECTRLAAKLQALADTPTASDLLADCDALVKSIRTMVDKLPVTSKALQKELDTVAGQVADTMEGMAALAGDAKAMKTALAETADAVGDTMALLRPATEKLLTSLESTIDDLEGLTTDEYMDTLVNILGGDPAVYGQYFPEMVQTSVNAVYPIANYGSAMTPFYTVLAIWVGGVILSSLIKIHARTEGLIDPKPAELYFGRYLFFFVLSQIQAAVIVTGDLYILKVQCLHPGMLYLTGALTAFTFSLLIYSLALAFGDIGKAIVVVIMVVQIAGSSGSYPIEILPDIFSKIYLFFPFPYAINAMREAIFGMYRWDYLIYLGELLIFGAAGIAIGLVVRKPFIKMNRFVEDEMEKSGVL